jgi:hypothetical protein
MSRRQYKGFFSFSHPRSLGRYLLVVLFATTPSNPNSLTALNSASPSENASHVRQDAE